MVMITIRLIRSFQHRNVRNLIVPDVSLDWSTEDLAAAVGEKLELSHLPPPFKNHKFDTFKIEHQAFGFKSSNPVINLENDEGLLLRPGVKLMDLGVKNETEISYFKMQDYQQFKEDPNLEF